MPDFRRCVAILFVLVHGAGVCRSAEVQSPGVKDVLEYRPSQRDVEFETPKPAEFAKCKLKVQKVGRQSAWVLYGPLGQVLRRFVDTDGDRTVDEYRYFNLGLETFRDVDNDGNGKLDQCRWLNTGGTRWGIDRNEDRRIDEWKILSAEEAARVAVKAMLRDDEHALRTVLINSEDIRALGLKQDVGRQLLESVKSPGKTARAVIARAKTVTRDSKWIRFDAQSPGLIPADDGTSSRDLMVYENAMAIIETDGKTGLLQIGEMVRVDNVWKLTRVPQVLEGSGVQVTAGGVLMQPALAALEPEAAGQTVSPAMRGLLGELQELDANSPRPGSGASRAELARYNKQRADIVGKLISRSETPADREMYTRQLADGLAAAVQSGSYPVGLKQLQDLETGVRRTAPKSPLVPYVRYRRLLAEYFVRVQSDDNEKRQAAQQWWHDQLESFAEAWPDADDTADALLQLAQSHEFSGKMDEARQWYTRLTTRHADSNPGKRADGALRRLKLRGKTLLLSGKDLNGYAVARWFWFHSGQPGANCARRTCLRSERCTSSTAAAGSRFSVSIWTASLTRFRII